VKARLFVIAARGTDGRLDAFDDGDLNLAAAGGDVDKFRAASPAPDPGLFIACPLTAPSAALQCPN